MSIRGDLGVCSVDLFDGHALTFCQFDPIRYYSFDESVVREILGKKLNSRTRKDLDEVHEKTGVKLTSCRRQVLRQSSCEVSLTDITEGLT